MAWTTPGTAVAGDVLTASFWNSNVRDNLNVFAQLGEGSTTNYSSSITFGGLTKGNADIKAYYQQTGKNVWYFGYVTLGSTSSMSATNLTISLPVTCVGAQYGFVGAANYVDSGTKGWVGSCTVVSSTSIGFMHTETGNFGDVNGTNPFTFGANDYFRWNIWYQAA